MKRKYKALICDVDGTIVSKKIGKLPSEKVTNVIQNAHAKIHIGLATARPLFLINHITKHLKLTGPSIINGGAQVVDVESGVSFWEQSLLHKDLGNIFSALRKLKIPFFINDDGYDIEISKDYHPKKPYSITTIRISNDKADALIAAVKHIPSISAHKFSWQEGAMGVSINHANATKQHAILEIAKALKIETHEIIGVGDSLMIFLFLWHAD